MRQSEGYKKRMIFVLTDNRKIDSLVNNFLEWSIMKKKNII